MLSKIFSLFKRPWPEITLVRFVLVALIVWCVSTFIWYCTLTKEIPESVMRSGISVQFLRNWPLAIFPVFLFLTVFAALKGYTKASKGSGVSPLLPGAGDSAAWPETGDSWHAGRDGRRADRGNVQGTASAAAGGGATVSG